MAIAEKCNSIKNRVLLYDNLKDYNFKHSQVSRDLMCLMCETINSEIMLTLYVFGEISIAFSENILHDQFMQT